MDRHFRIYDDDGELYYAGVYGEGDNPGDEDQFAPLDEFGTPNAGATEIRYRSKNGVWITL